MCLLGEICQALGRRPSGDAKRMSEKKKQEEELTDEELEQQDGEELPDREVMSVNQSGGRRHRHDRAGRTTDRKLAAV